MCGGRLLDDAWAAATAASITELTSQAAAADAAHTEESAAVRALGQLVPPKPPVLSADLGADIDPAAAGMAWDRPARPAPGGEPGELTHQVTAPLAY